MGGSSSSISYEYSGGFLGADNEFQKYTADTGWFFNPWWNHVFAIHARAGYMQSKSSDRRELFYERFYLGGVDTVRGYENWEIYPDPDESGQFNFLGGNKVFFTNLEYRIPVSPQLTTAVFFDFGQVWDESTTNVFSEINMKRGLGLEARFTFDEEVLERVLGSHERILTVEEGTVVNGFGALMAREIQARVGSRPTVRTMGLPDVFIEHGDRGLLLAEVGLDAEGIAREALRLAGPSPDIRVMATRESA